MINSFRMLGKSILQKNGYYDTEDENQKREIYLKKQSIVPKQRGNGPERAIAIHFDTQKHEFIFELDKEITPENRDYFFAFSYSSFPRLKKKCLSTTQINSFYTEVFSNSVDDLKKNRNDKQLDIWFSESISENYDKLMQEIKDIFYVKVGKDYLLNKEMMRSDHKAIFREIEKKENAKTIPPESIYTTFISKIIPGNEEKSKGQFPAVALVKIDGKTIIEHEDLKTSYINLVYYDFFERLFIKNTKKTKVCHTCTRTGDVIGEIPLQMKFYGTTNNLYFENLNNSIAYKSFAICRRCLKEVLTGMKFTEYELKDRIFDIDCYLIPVLEAVEQDFQHKYKRIFNLLKANKNYQEDVVEIEKLIKKSTKKDIKFSLLFFEKNKQEFNIIKLISSIEYKKLISKLMLFHDVNKTYDLSLLKRSLGFNDLRFHLFPSEKSHNKPDPRLYRKDILDLLESFLHGYSVNYHMLIKRFMHIYRLRFNRENTDALAAFKMVLWFSIFNKIKPLKGVGTMEGKAGNTVTEIQNEDYRKFIEAHQVIYEKNFHRQGLFLLGTVINSIVYAQRDKSSSFMRKLNFSGIPARQVNRLVGEVQNYYQIYNKDIYEEPGIWGNIMDRLQGIEESSMKPEEIVFYILTGISYAKYIGIKKGMEKKEGK